MPYFLKTGYLTNSSIAVAKMQLFPKTKNRIYNMRFPNKLLQKSLSGKLSDPVFLPVQSYHAALLLKVPCH